MNLRPGWTGRRVAVCDCLCVVCACGFRVSACSLIKVKRPRAAHLWVGGFLRPCILYMLACVHRLVVGVAVAVGGAAKQGIKVRGAASMCVIAFPDGVCEMTTASFLVLHSKIYAKKPPFRM
jgi:hypothetical protein